MCLVYKELTKKDKQWVHPNRGEEMGQRLECEFTGQAGRGEKGVSVPVTLERHLQDLL